MSPSVAISQLAQAHAQAVQVFGRYQLHQPVEGCPCCVSEQDDADLRQGNLRRYASKAMTTWGNETDFKHFLPIILTELTPVSSYYPGTVHGGTCDLELLAGKLAYAHWQQWPAVEQQVIPDCLRAWWLVCLHLLRQEFAEFLAGRSAGGWSRSIEPAYKELVQSGLLPAPWLQQTCWESWQPASNQSEAAYVQSPAFLLLVDWLYSLYYQEGAAPPEASLRADIRGKLEVGFFYYSDREPDLAQRLSNLLYYVEHSPAPGQA